MRTRHVGAIDGNGQFVVIEEAIPELKDGEILVEVKASLISPGTEFMDVAKLRKEPVPQAEPVKFGYSNAGVVAKLGPGCEDMHEGARVACMGYGCAYHADYAVIPKGLSVPIPDGMSFDKAAFAHLGATAIQALRRAELQMGENLLVIGLGPVGQLAVQLAEASAVHAIAMERLSFRLDIAKKGGAELTVNPAEKKEEDIIADIKKFTRGYGVDCTLLAFGGDASPVMEFIKKVHKSAPDKHLMGRVVIPGACEIKLSNWPVSFGNIDIRASSRTGPGYKDSEYEHGKEYTPVFIQWTTRRNMEEFLRLDMLKKINIEALITHRLQFKDFIKGVETLYTKPNEALGMVFMY